MRWKSAWPPGTMVGRVGIRLFLDSLRRDRGWGQIRA